MGHLLQDFLSLHDPPGRARSLGRPNPVSYPVSISEYDISDILTHLYYKQYH